MNPSVFLKILVVLTVSIIPLKGSAQNTYRRNEKVARYYFYKNKAELAIIDSQYNESLTLFKKAFECKSPNARDLSNSLRLSLILQDTSFAQKCFNDLALNGLPKNVTTNFMGEDLTGAGSLYQYLSKDYDSLIAEFKKSAKYRLEPFLDSIYERDQRIRRTNYTDEEMTRVDKSNVDSLIWFAQEYGFPGFDLLGFADPCGGLGTGGIYWFILWHSRNQEIGELDSLGLEAVMQGLYPPDEFAQAFDFKNDTSKYHMLAPGISTMVNEDKLILSEDEVNKNRAAIYLESMEDYKKKLRYMKSKGKKWHQFLLTPQYIFTMNFAR